MAGRGDGGLSGAVAKVRHLGIVGFGNIGRALVDVLAGAVEGPLDRLTLLVRPRQTAEAVAESARVRGRLAGEIDCVADVGALVAARPDLLVECAGHGAVREAALPALAGGIETVVASVGALADAALHGALVEAARTGGARLVLPAGAIGGIDLLRAVGTAGIEAVTYVGRKPPAAWRGTPAEGVLDLGSVAAPTTFFAGDARAAAKAYPKNANVAATLALAGVGFERTRVELIADPGAVGNLHAFEVRSAAARFEVRIEGRASPDNPKTSLATVHSLAREVLNRIGPVAI
jgi:aspartate dehydrogenase